MGARRPVLEAVHATRPQGAVRHIIPDPQADVVVRHEKHVSRWGSTTLSAALLYSNWREYAYKTEQCC